MGLRTTQRAAAAISSRVILFTLALAGCSSEPDRPVGPGPDPDGSTGGETALVFADSALHSAVEEAAAGTGDATGLVSLTAKERGIADLGGIEQLTRLEVLDLYGNEIRDLTPLEGLGRLRYLDLGANRVEDVSPLASLKSLQVLLLADNAVAEVPAFAGLDSLQSVDLTGNPLSDAAQTRLAALRERGVTVEFTSPEPEPEDSVEVVPPEEPPEGFGSPLGGQQLVFASNRRREDSYLSGLEVHTLDLETGEVVNLSAALAVLPYSDGAVPDTLVDYHPRSSEEPARSPDGTKVAFTSRRERNLGLEIYVLDAGGGDPVNLTRHPANDHSAAWSPDGQRIAFVSTRGGDSRLGHLFVMDADGGGVEQLTEEPQASWAFWPAWSPDGSVISCVASQAGVEGIFAVDVASGVMRLLSAEGGESSWSPDGARIAYTVRDTTSDSNHIWSMEADGTGARQLTSGEVWDRTPTWSPDGGRIAFARQTQEETRYDIYIVPAEGGDVERVTDDPNDDMHPNWTPF